MLIKEETVPAEKGEEADDQAQKALDTYANNRVPKTYSAQ